MLLNPQGGEGVVRNIFWNMGKKYWSSLRYLYLSWVCLYVTIMGCIVCNPFSPSVTPQERLSTEALGSLLRSLWELKGIPQMQPRRRLCMHTQTNWGRKTSRCLKKVMLFSYFCWRIIRSLLVSLAVPNVSVESDSAVHYDTADSSN